MFHQRDLAEKPESKCRIVPQFPQRLGEPDCRDFLRTGRCKYGDSCKYHHPIGGAKLSTDPSEPPFPIRPNEPPCQYYLKHGTCKFGQTCKFHHPPHLLGTGTAGLPASVVMTMSSGSFMTKSSSGIFLNESTNNDYQQNGLHLLPQRPGEPDCIYFLRNGRCKYGSTCKYHHPIHRLELSPVGRQTSHQYQQYRSNNGRGRSISTGSVIDMNQMQSIISGPGSGPLFNQNQQPIRKAHDGDDRVTNSSQLLFSGGQSPPSSIPKFADNKFPSSYHHYGDKQMKSTISNGFGQYRNGPVAEDAPLTSANTNVTFTKHLTSPDASPSMGSTAVMSASASASSYDTVTSLADFHPGSPTQSHTLQRGNHPRQHSHQPPMEPNAAWNPNYYQPQSFPEVNGGEQDIISNPSYLSPALSTPSDHMTQSGVGSNDKCFGNNIRARSNSLNQYVPRPTMNLPQSGSHSLNNSRHLQHGWSSNMSISTLSQSSLPTWETKPNVLDDNAQERLATTKTSLAKDANSATRDEPLSKDDNSLLETKSKRNHFQHGNFDDGLSMMTSALLTMLDSPDDVVAKANVNKEEFSANRGYQNPSSLYSASGNKKEVLVESFNRPSNTLDNHQIDQDNLDGGIGRKYNEQRGNLRTERTAFQNSSSFPS